LPISFLNFPISINLLYYKSGLTGCNTFFAYFASTPNLLLSIIYTIKNCHIAHELPDPVVPVVLLGNVGWVRQAGGRVGLVGIAAELLD